MRKSLLIQAAILSLIIIIVFFSYRFFLYEEQNKEGKDLAKIDKNIIEKKDTNKIEDLNYSSTDENGNIYEIFSKTGTVDKEDINILYLKKVKAIIKIKNSGVINLASDFAKYNKSNLNTHFYENVKLKFKRRFL